MGIFNQSKKEVVTNNTTTQNYSYKKGDVTLNFSLTGDKQHKDFEDCLKEALAEMEARRQENHKRAIALVCGGGANGAGAPCGVEENSKS